MPATETLTESEMLDWAAIEERYAPDWVFLSDVEADESLKVIRGRVLAHAASQGDVYRLALPKAKGGRYAVLFLGKLPDDAMVVL